MRKTIKKMIPIIATLLVISTGCNKPKDVPSPTATVSEVSFLVGQTGKLADELLNGEITVVAGDTINLGIKLVYSDGARVLVPVEKIDWSVDSQENNALMISNNFRGFKVGTYKITAKLDEKTLSNAPKEINKTIHVIAGSPANVEILDGNNQTDIVTTRLSKELKVRVVDLYNNPVPKAKVNFSSESGQVVSGDVISNEYGEASTFYILGLVSGQQSVRAETGIFIKKFTNFTVNANPDVPYQLVIRDTPESALTGQNFQKSLKIYTQDRYQNDVKNDSREIKISAFLDDKCTVPANGTLMISSEKLVSNNGLAIVSQIAYSKYENIYIKATSDIGVLRSGCSPKITINPNLPNKLMFKTQPSSLYAGNVFSVQPIIEIQDFLGNTVDNSNGSIQLKAFLDSSCSIPTEGMLTYTEPVLFLGTSRFTNLAYSKSERIYIQASFNYGGNLIKKCSDPVTLSPNEPTQMSFSSYPIQVTAGENFQVRLVTKDYLGNNNLNYSKVITLIPYTDSQCKIQSSGKINGLKEGIKFDNNFLATLTNGSNIIQSKENIPGGVSVGQDISGDGIDSETKIVAINGRSITVSKPVKTSKDLTVRTTGVVSVDLNFSKAGTLFLKATTEDFTTCSGAITVRPNLPYYISFINQPASYNGVIAKFLTYNPQVAIKDYYGNLVSDESGVVDIKAYSDSGCTNQNITGVFTGNSANIIGGIAVFSPLAYNDYQTIYFKAIYFKNGTMLSDCSNAVNFNPDTSNYELDFQVSPGGANVIAGQIFLNQPIVRILDIQGRPISINLDGKVSLAAYTDSTCNDAFIAPGKLNATSSSLINGTATFFDVYYSQSGRIYIKASYGIKSKCSEAIDVQSASISQLVFSTYPPSSVSAGEIFDTFKLEAQDSFGNKVTLANGSAQLKAYVNNTCTVAAGDTLVNDIINAEAGVISFSQLKYKKAEVIYIKAFYNYGNYFISSPCSNAIIIKPNSFVDYLIVQSFPSIVVPNQEPIQQPILNTVDNYGNKVAIKSNVFYNFFTDSNCSNVALNQQSFSTLINGGETDNPHIIMNNGGTYYISASVPNSNITKCLPITINVAPDLSLNTIRSEIGSGQSESLIISGGGLPYSCQIDKTAFPTYAGFNSTFSSDCTTYYSGNNDSKLNTEFIDPVSGTKTTLLQYTPIKEKIVVTDKYGQKATVVMTVYPKLTATISKSFLRQGEALDWNFLNNAGNLTCSTTSSIGSVISGCDLNSIERKYTGGTNSTGIILNEVFTIKDSLNQTVSFTIDILPSLQFNSSYNPTALSECEQLTIKTAGGSFFSKNLNLPIYSDKGVFHSNNTCTSPTTSVTILKDTNQSIVWYKPNSLSAGVHKLNFGSTDPNENYSLTVLDLPSISIKANGTFNCSNGTCPNSVYTSSGVFYVDGIKRLVNSNIPVGTTSLSVNGGTSGFEVGQKIIVITIKTKGADTSRVGNYELLRITKVNSDSLEVKQIKINSGTSIVQNGILDYVQAQVVPEFVRVDIESGSTLSSSGYDYNSKLGGLFALTALKSIKSDNASINMSYKGFFGAMVGKSFGEGISDIDSFSYGGGFQGTIGDTACSNCWAGWPRYNFAGVYVGEGGFSGGHSGAGGGGGGGSYMGTTNGLRITLGSGGGRGGYGGSGGSGGHGGCSYWGCAFGNGALPGQVIHGGAGSGAGGGGTGYGTGYQGFNGSTGGNGGSWNFNPQDQRGGGMIYINSREVSGINFYSFGYDGHLGGDGGQGGKGGDGGSSCDRSKPFNFPSCTGSAIGAGGGGGGGGGGAGSGGGIVVISETISSYSFNNSGGNGGLGGTGGCSGGGPSCGCGNVCDWGRAPSGGAGEKGAVGATSFYFNKINGNNYSNTYSGNGKINSNTSSGFGFGGQWSESLWAF